MSKNQSFIFIIAILFCSLVSSFGETVREMVKRDSKFHLYAVIFGITVNSESKIDGFRMDKVIEPKSGTTDPVKINVPEDFIERARKKLSTLKKYKPKFKDGKPVEFFTYVFFSPEYPKVVIIDMDASIEKQP